MSDIRVYNTGTYPVVYGDGRVIGGLEWATVDRDDVTDQIASGSLIVVDQITDSVTSEEPSIDDSKSEETAVSSEEAAEETQGDDEPSSDDVQSVEEPEIAPTPATIRKSRRRKQSQEKE